MGEAGVATHFRRLLSNNEIEVILTERVPLEVIYRAKACGSFLARYRGRIEPMAPLDIVEFNLKDDALGDPLITHEGIARLGLASEGELREMEAIVRKVAALVAKVLGERGLELIDMKLEFGRSNDRLLVIDELSGDTMRIFDPVQKRLINQVEFAGKLGLI
jgi:phosphoribosylaminoimidazole-succinocarboxamide synthase